MPGPSSESPAPAAHRATRRSVEAVWRIESARLIAALTRALGDINLAEDVAQDALVAALEHWPETGIPANPAAWLMTASKRRAIDVSRRRSVLDRKQEEIGLAFELAGSGVPDPAEIAETAADAEANAAAGSPDIEDDLLRLVFIACHPLLSPEARVALTLRMVGGLSTAEIARAFLVAESTVAQRIVRAKRTLAAARVPFEVPAGADRAARIASVLEVIYLIFNEGYTASAGEDWMRPGLCDEALRLGRILAGLAPNESEVHGLVALMEIQASRAEARTRPSGEPVLLLDQNRALWDRRLIGRGLAALELAQRMGGALGSYALQAAIAACHARAPTAADTDWVQVTALYDALAQVAPSPVIELNRAVAVSMAFGPEAGLELVDALTKVPALDDYHLLPALRGDLLVKLGRPGEASAEFARAASLTDNARERQLMLKRSLEAAGSAPGGDAGSLGTARGES